MWKDLQWASHLVCVFSKIYYSQRALKNNRYEQTVQSLQCHELFPLLTWAHPYWSPDFFCHISPYCMDCYIASSVPCYFPQDCRYTCFFNRVNPSLGVAPCFPIRYLWKEHETDFSLVELANIFFKKVPCNGKRLEVRSREQMGFPVYRGGLSPLQSKKPFFLNRQWSFLPAAVSTVWLLKWVHISWHHPA